MNVVAQIRRLKELPAKAWKFKATIHWGYNAQTRVFVIDLGVPLLNDTGATNNTAPEELACAIVNKALRDRIDPKGENWPTKDLQWADETVNGIKADVEVSVNGLCKLWIEFRGVRGQTGCKRWLELAIFKAGDSDFPGLILGLPQLEVAPLGY